MTGENKASREAVKSVLAVQSAQVEWLKWIIDILQQF
jgi:hypothetical protein